MPGTDDFTDDGIEPDGTEKVLGTTSHTIADSTTFLVAEGIRVLEVMRVAEGIRVVEGMRVAEGIRVAE